MKISRGTRNHPYRMPRSSIFNETGPGIRVIRKKYLLDADLVHEHDFHELVLVLSGSGFHMTEDGEYPLSRGDLYLVRPGCLHGYRDLDGLEIVNILFLPERLGMPFAELRGDPGYLVFFELSPQLADSFRPRFRLDAEAMRNAETVIDAMLAEQLKPKACSGFALKAYFMQMVVLILRAFASSAGTGNGDGLLRLGQWFRRLEERSGEPLQISELAKEHGMSVRSLERCFLELTGRTPKECLTEIRLAKAMRLLTSTELPISHVACRAGFSGAGYFSRVFRRRYGSTPGSCRRSATAGGLNDASEPME